MRVEGVNPLIAKLLEAARTEEQTRQEYQQRILRKALQAQAEAGEELQREVEGLGRRLDIRA